MSVQAGEELLLTHFADVHYYISAPGVNPVHHRFDKASYVYLYRSRAQNQGRLEVANHAGTAERDAFTGYLNSTQLEYAYDHPTLLTITVEGQVAHGSQAAPGRERDWHLPAPDHRGEGKYLYKLHTVDLYFYKEAEAAEFLGLAQGILPSAQITILDAETAKVAQHSDVMSPVVQKLEQAAMSDTTGPAGSQGRSGSAEIESMTFDILPAGGEGPGRGMQGKGPEVQPAQFAPLAYNPAAPAAPEPIKNREKTPPPPVEGGDGTGLATAAAQDSGAPYIHPSLSHQSPYSSPPPAQYFAGPPQQHSYPPPPPSAISHQGSQPSPAPSGSPFGQPQPHRTSSFPPPPPPPPTGNTSSAGQPPVQQYAQTFAPPPQGHSAQLSGQMSPPLQSPPLQGYQPQSNTAPQQQYHPQQHHYPQSPGYASPGVQSPGISPTGGYSNYQYGQSPPPQQQYQPQQGDPYGIHSQLYRPTEGEAAHHGKPPSAGPGQQPGRLEAQSARVEKGVNRLFKKLEKRIG